MTIFTKKFIKEVFAWGNLRLSQVVVEVLEEVYACGVCISARESLEPFDKSNRKNSLNQCFLWCMVKYQTESRSWVFWSDRWCYWIYISIYTQGVHLLPMSMALWELMHRLLYMKLRQYWVLGKFVIVVMNFLTKLEF